MRWSDELIEFVLMHEEEIKTAVVEARLDSGSKGERVGGKGSHIGNPTASNAIRNAMGVPSVRIAYGPKMAGMQAVKLIKNPEKWLKVASAVRSFYSADGTASETEQEFFARRYVKQEYWKDTCAAMNMKRDTYYAMKASAIRTTELYAVFYGALSPMECRV